MYPRIEFEKSILFKKKDCPTDFIFFKRDTDTRKRKTEGIPKKILTVDVSPPEFPSSCTHRPTHYSIVLICHQQTANNTNQIVKVRDHIFLHPTQTTRDVPFNIPLAKGKIRNREFIFVGVDHDTETVTQIEWKLNGDEAYYKGFFKVLSRNTKGDGVKKQIDQGLTTISDELWSKIAATALEKDEIVQPASSSPRVESEAKRRRVEPRSSPQPTQSISPTPSTSDISVSSTTPSPVPSSPSVSPIMIPTVVPPLSPHSTQPSPYSFAPQNHKRVSSPMYQNFFMPTSSQVHQMPFSSASIPYPLAPSPLHVPLFYQQQQQFNPINTETSPFGHEEMLAFLQSADDLSYGPDHTPTRDLDCVETDLDISSILDDDTVWKDMPLDTLTSNFLRECERDRSIFSTTAALCPSTDSACDNFVVSSSAISTELDSIDMLNQYVYANNCVDSQLNEIFVSELSRPSMNSAVDLSKKFSLQCKNVNV